MCITILLSGSQSVPESKKAVEKGKVAFFSTDALSASLK